MIQLLLLSLLFSNNEISYRKLSWNDFVKVGKLKDASAITATTISYDYVSNEPVKVYCTLIKNQSFVETKSISTALLNHEQRHFDLTYIYSRKLAFLLKEKPGLSEVEIKEIYDGIIEEWDAEQNLYDEQTDNSINKEKQELWDRFIDNQLKKL